MLRIAKITLVLCLSVTATLGAAPAAFSQEDGVTIDPGDPAAKEYALPHEEARREAGDTPAKRVEQGSRDSALFGEGVQPDAASGSAAGAKSSRPTESAEKRRDRSPTPEAPTTPLTVDSSGTTPTDDAEVALADDDASGPGPTAVMLGGAGAALLAALLGGFGLRAMRGPRDHA